MRLSLHLPAKPTNPPLVLALHYGGQPVGYYGRGLLETLVVPAWRALDAVFVAPVSLGGAWQTADNLAALLALVEELTRVYATDRARAVVTGYSLGAAGCWHLAAEASPRFSAAVPLAGAPPNPTDPINVPVYALHSRADQLFGFADVEAAIAALVAGGTPIALHALASGGHFDVAAFVPAL